jgi:lysozyme family protein
MTNNFDIAFERLIGHEGKFSTDRQDPGNWTSGKVGQGQFKGTKFGIAANTYPHLDIRNLTLEQAKKIYYSDWWLKLSANSLPFPVVYQLWDFAINSGIRRAVMELQQVVGFTGREVDGVMGPKTTAAINAMASTNMSTLLILLTARRIKFMTSLRNWPAHGRGWMQRVAINLEYAAKDKVNK